MTKLIYLASPYSHRYGYIRERRFVEVSQKAAKLMEDGFLVFCPIAHSHPIEIHGMPRRMPGDWWLRQDFAILSKCDELLVYKMPGWDKSYGVAKEIEFANNNNIPIKYLEYEQAGTN
jgi:nucleoside 2-deoxyribosyltransferase